MEDGEDRVDDDAELEEWRHVTDDVNSHASRTLVRDGGEGQNRTVDTTIFSHHRPEIR